MRYLFIILILLLSGCVAKIDNKQILQPEKNDIAIAKKKVLMVIAPKDFSEAEYIEPRSIIENSGAEIKVASIQSGIAMGIDGAEVNIDLTVSEADFYEYDAVVFIGGPGMEKIIDDESLQILAMKFNIKKKLVAAICAAPAILAKAEILSDKQAAACPGNKSEIEEAGAIYTGEAVAVDGNIITANGPQAAREFGEKIVEMLK